MNVKVNELNGNDKHVNMIAEIVIAEIIAIIVMKGLNGLDLVVEVVIAEIETWK